MTPRRRFDRNTHQPSQLIHRHAAVVGLAVLGPRYFFTYRKARFKSFLSREICVCIFWRKAILRWFSGFRGETTLNFSYRNSRTSLCPNPKRSFLRNKQVLKFSICLRMLRWDSKLVSQILSFLFFSNFVTGLCSFFNAWHLFAVYANIMITQASVVYFCTAGRIVWISFWVAAMFYVKNMCIFLRFNVF